MDLNSPSMADTTIDSGLPEETWIEPMPDAKVVPADGDPTIVCRDNEAYWLERTCPFRDVEIWVDGEGTNPAAKVRPTTRNARR